MGGPFSSRGNILWQIAGLLLLLSLVTAVALRTLGISYTWALEGSGVACSTRKPFSQEAVGRPSVGQRQRAFPGIIGSCPGYPSSISIFTSPMYFL